jgi:hypothetical protein
VKGALALQVIVWLALLVICKIMTPLVCKPVQMNITLRTEDVSIVDIHVKHAL